MPRAEEVCRFVRPRSRIEDGAGNEGFPPGQIIVGAHKREAAPRISTRMQSFNFSLDRAALAVGPKGRAAITLTMARLDRLAMAYRVGISEAMKLTVAGTVTRRDGLADPRGTPVSARGPALVPLHDTAGRGGLRSYFGRAAGLAERCSVFIGQKHWRLRWRYYCRQETFDKCGRKAGIAPTGERRPPPARSEDTTFAGAGAAGQSKRNRRAKAKVGHILRAAFAYMGPTFQILATSGRLPGGDCRSQLRERSPRPVKTTSRDGEGI